MAELEDRQTSAASRRVAGCEGRDFVLFAGPGEVQVRDRSVEFHPIFTPAPAITHLPARTPKGINTSSNIPHLTGSPQ